MDDTLMAELEAPSVSSSTSASGRFGAIGNGGDGGRARGRSIGDRLMGVTAKASEVIRASVEMLPFTGDRRRSSSGGDGGGAYAKVASHERGLLSPGGGIGSPGGGADGGSDTAGVGDSGGTDPDIDDFMNHSSHGAGQREQDVEALLSGTAETVRDVWAPEANLDAFFARMYQYYHAKGFPSILASHVTSLITLAFTVTFSTFLLVFVDWRNLLVCGEGGSALTSHACQTLDTYIKYEALQAPNLFQHLVFGYFFLFSAYWLVTLLWSIPTLMGAWRMHVLFRDRLKITTRDLQTMDWTEIVAAFDKLHRSRQYRVQLSRSVSTFHIASRVMRKDNFLIALMNKNMLDFALPCCGCKVPFTKTLEWNLHWTLLNHMFDAEFKLREQFTSDVAALQRRFIVFGLINLALLPFTLLFMVMFFFLKNAEEFHKKGDYLGPRKWSPRALWKFREFNELPHIFERRINGSYKPANEYEQQFPVPVMTVIAKCTAFIAGSLAAVLLMLALVDEELLLHIHLLDRNLLWYIAVFSGILAISRAFIPTPEQSVLSPSRAMRKLVAFTHYMPKRWRGRFKTYDVRDEFLSLYQFKVVLFLHEILGAVTTPLVLLFVLPWQAQSIVSFIQRVSVTSPNLGSVCGYAMFDLRKFGNRKYGAPVHASKLYRSRQGKMEKSLLSFQANNPDWSAEDDGVELLQLLTRFQASQSAAITGRAPPVTTALLGASALGPAAATAAVDNLTGTGYLGQPGATAPQGMPGWGIGASGALGHAASPNPTAAASMMGRSLNALGSATLARTRRAIRLTEPPRGSNSSTSSTGSTGNAATTTTSDGDDGERKLPGSGDDDGEHKQLPAAGPVGVLSGTTGSGVARKLVLDSPASAVRRRMADDVGAASVPNPNDPRRPPVLVSPQQLQPRVPVTPHPPHPTHVPLPSGSPTAAAMLGGADGMHAGRAMTGQFVWNPFEPLSAQSLLLPLGALTPEQQENHFFWLDRFYEASTRAEEAAQRGDGSAV